MQISIGVFGDAEEVIVLPEYDDANAGELIELAATKLCNEATRRKNERRSSPATAKAWEAWLRPICYRAVSFLIEEGFEGEIRARIKRYGRHTTTENVFSVFLLGIFAGDRACFTDSDRHRLSRQLWYAYRHYVPWEFLNGFLLQLKDFDVQDDLNRIESGFEEWIVERRALSTELPSIRGSYPKEIEDGCRELMQRYCEMLDRRSGIRRN